MGLVLGLGLGLANGNLKSLESEWKSKRLQNQRLGDENIFILRGNSRGLKEKVKIFIVCSIFSG